MSGIRGMLLAACIGVAGVAGASGPALAAEPAGIQRLAWLRGCWTAANARRTIDEHWETHRLFLGVASNYLCDLKEGDKVTVTGPNGKRFVLPADPASRSMASASLTSSAVRPPASWVDSVTSTRFHTFSHSG